MLTKFFDMNHIHYDKVNSVTLEYTRKTNWLKQSVLLFVMWTTIIPVKLNSGFHVTVTDLDITMKI